MSKLLKQNSKNLSRKDAETQRKRKTLSLCVSLRLCMNFFKHFDPNNFDIISFVPNHLQNVKTIDVKM